MNYKVCILSFLVFILSACDDFALYNLQDSVWENKVTQDYESYKEVRTITLTFGATTYTQDTKVVQLFQDGKQTESTDSMQGSYDQFDSNIKLMYVIDGQYEMRYGKINESTIHLEGTDALPAVDYYRIK